MNDAVDLLLLTALTEEKKTVEAVLDLKATRVRRRDHLALFEYPSKERLFRVASACAFHQGAVSMGIFAASILSEIRPRVAVLVGIAAAADLDEVGLGDVPSTRMVLSYDDIKVRDGKLTIRSAGYTTDVLVFNAIEEIRSSEKSYARWKKECRSLIHSVVKVLNTQIGNPKKRIKKKPVRQDPDIVTAITGGGPFLLQDADFRDELRGERRKPKLPLPEKYSSIEFENELHPKLVSVEMESHGFMQAANFRRIPAMVLKGIADEGDESKTRIEKESKGFYRAYACSNAVVTALQMLEYLDLPQIPPSLEQRMWDLVGEYARDVFTWGNPVVVHGDVEQYARFAQSLLNDQFDFVLWTVNGSPLDVSESLDEHHLTAWDKKFRDVKCKKRRLVVFRTEQERFEYVRPSNSKNEKRRIAFEEACGDSLHFTSVPKLHDVFPAFGSTNILDQQGKALDIGFVSTEGRDLFFYSPFATREHGKQMPTIAPIVLFSTNVGGPDPHGNDHKESGELLGRLVAYQYFVRVAIGPAAELSSWLYTKASDVPSISSSPKE